MTGRVCMEGQMSTTVERVKEWMDGYIQQREKEYGSAFHKDEKSIEEFYNFLASLAAERCVWKRIKDPDFEEAYYYESDCGSCVEDSLAQEWFKTPDESKWYLCKCGKRIEIKEADNG